MMAGVCLSVCRILTPERNGLGSPKLAGEKLITRVTSEPIYYIGQRSKIKVTRSMNAVTIRRSEGISVTQR